MRKISVVLPVYNGEAYLKESIDSILNQTYQDFELIIVDDCSVDNTSMIAESYAKSHSNIIYVKNEVNLKLPASLNKGFSLALGEYWTWTSHDNLYFPQAFEKLLAEYKNDNQLGLVYASMEIINEKGKVIDYCESGSAEDLILRNVIGACFLYRASIAKQVGLYNQDSFLCEDYEYWVRLACLSTLKPVQECLYQYRRHSGALSAQHEKEIIEKGIRVQKKYYPFFVKTREKAAFFYAYLRARDKYNPFRYFYFLKVFYYSPSVFMKEILRLFVQRVKKYAKN